MKNMLKINLQLFAGKTINTSHLNTDKRLKIDMANDIALLQPSAAPFTVITQKMKKEVASNPRFEWLDRELEGRVSKASAEALAAATSITVPDGSFFRAGMLVKVPTSGEVLQVTGVSSNTLTVLRGYGETAAATIAANTQLVIIGNANAEGAAAPDDAAGSPVAEYNFTQIFRTPFAITNTANKVKIFGAGNAFLQEQKIKAIEHRIDIERAFLFGERKEDLSGSHPKRTTRGVLGFLKENNLNISDGLLDEKTFNNWLEGVFAYGSDKRLLLASPRLISVISSWGAGKLQTVPGADKVYGFQCTRYISPHGELNIVKQPLFTGGYSGMGVAIDLNDVSYKYIEGRDTNLITNIQNNDVDGRRDEYLTEAGLMLRLPKHHGVITGVTGAK